MADSPPSNSPIIKFMAWRRPALLMSGLLTTLSIVLIVFKGLALGLDFSGGTQVELHFPQAVETEAVRTRLSAAGFVSISTEAIEARSTAPTAKEPALAYVQGTPLRNEVEARDPARLEEATMRASQALS